MKFILQLVCFIAGLITCLASLGETPSKTSNITAARTACGYDLAQIQDSVIDSKINSLEDGRFQQTFMLGWASGKKHFHGVLTLDCTSNGKPTAGLSAPILTPEEIIIEEDSGGRYARHVAWQKSINANNWTAKIAYVDHVIGDGQRIKLNDFLICNSTIATPCIKLSITAPQRISNKDIRYTLVMLGKISVVP